jgi:hypothetical protein
LHSLFDKFWKSFIISCEILVPFYFWTQFSEMVKDMFFLEFPSCLQPFKIYFFWIPNITYSSRTDHNKLSHWSSLDSTKIWRLCAGHKANSSRKMANRKKWWDEREFAWECYHNHQYQYERVIQLAEIALGRYFKSSY